MQRSDHTSGASSRSGEAWQKSRGGGGERGGGGSLGGVVCSIQYSDSFDPGSRSPLGPRWVPAGSPLGPRCLSLLLHGLQDLEAAPALDLAGNALHRARPRKSQSYKGWGSSDALRGPVFHKSVKVSNHSFEDAVRLAPQCQTCHMSVSSIDIMAPALSNSPPERSKMPCVPFGAVKTQLGNQGNKFSLNAEANSTRVKEIIGISLQDQSRCILHIAVLKS